MFKIKYYVLTKLITYDILCVVFKDYTFFGGEKVYIAYSDASCDNQLTHRSSIGYIIYHGRSLICKASKTIDYKVNSIEAEYIALCELVKKIIELKIPKILIKTDCRTIVDQILGLANVNEKFFPYYKMLSELIKLHNNILIEWIPRNENKKANNLCVKSRKKNINNIDVYKNKIYIKRYINTQRIKFLRCNLCKERKIYTEFIKHKKNKICFHCANKLIEIMY